MLVCVLAVWGLGGYPIPQYDAPQTRRVQAMTRAFSMARVSLSSEQNSQTLDQSVLPKQTVRSTDHPSGWNAEPCGAAEMSKSATAERPFSDTATDTDTDPDIHTDTDTARIQKDPSGLTA